MAKLVYSVAFLKNAQALSFDAQLEEYGRPRTHLTQVSLSWALRKMDRRLLECEPAGKDLQISLGKKISR